MLSFTSHSQAGNLSWANSNPLPLPWGIKSHSLSPASLNTWWGPVTGMWSSAASPKVPVVSPSAQTLLLVSCAVSDFPWALACWHWDTVLSFQRAIAGLTLALRASPTGGLKGPNLTVLPSGSCPFGIAPASHCLPFSPILSSMYRKVRVLGGRRLNITDWTVSFCLLQRPNLISRGQVLMTKTALCYLSDSKQNILKHYIFGLTLNLALPKMRGIR